jgi:hypothetical protein
MEQDILTSKTFMKQYLDSEERLKFDLDKIGCKISNLNKDKDMKTIDNLLDVYNYTKASYKVIMIQYLVLFIMTYLREKNIIQGSDIPIQTAKRILNEQDWISETMNEFINKHFENIMNGDNIAQYVVDLNTYLINSDKI